MNENAAGGATPISGVGACSLTVEWFLGFGIVTNFLSTGSLFGSLFGLLVGFLGLKSYLAEKLKSVLEQNVSKHLFLEAGFKPTGVLKRPVFRTLFVFRNIPPLSQMYAKASGLYSASHSQ